LKLIFSIKDGKVLGAQAVGMEGVDKCINAIAQAIQQNSTVFDLEEAELCYAPQFSAAVSLANFKVCSSKFYCFEFWSFELV